MIDSIQMSDPKKIQRLGAYAIVTRAEEILLTKISVWGYPAGHWALPGGAVEHGESPQSTMKRELFEETGLTAVTARLVDVHDVHVVDRGRGDVFEDYHGVHLLYITEVANEEPLRVMEIDGTTESAAWVPWQHIHDLPIIPVVSHVLSRRADWGISEPGAG